MQAEVKNTNLTTTISQFEVADETAKSLEKSFMPFFEKAREWRKKAKELQVTDASQKEEMKAAREARLALKSIRVDANKTRKELKEDSLRYGRAVQGVYNVIEYMIKPIEEHLEKQERFVEIQEQQRKAELKDRREEELLPYEEFVPMGVDLGDMADAEYQKLLNGCKLQMQAKKEEEARQERERKEAERKMQLHQKRLTETRGLYQYIDNYDSIKFGELSDEEYDKLVNKAQEDERIAALGDERKQVAWGFIDFIKDFHGLNYGRMAENEFKELIVHAKAKKKEHLAEQERIRKENERLQKEREAAEKKAKAERKKAEEKLRKEREERERLQAEMKAKAEAEAKRKAEEEKARKKAEMAPDVEKLKSWIDEIEQTVHAMPTVKDKDINRFMNDLCDTLDTSIGAARSVIEKK